MGATGPLGQAITRRRSGLLLAASGLVSSACGSARSSAVPPGGLALDGVTPPANLALLSKPDWLSQNVSTAGVRIIDARPRADYEKGHIPGAVSLPVAETFDPARDKNYPDAVEKLEALFSVRGLGTATRIVAYDNGKETPAARLLWTLEYLGHQQVSLLDGGLSAWQAWGGAVTTTPATPETARFSAAVQATRMHAKADCERMLSAGTDRAAGFVMLDSRSPEEWRGDDVRAKFGGRIPGAVNLDWREHFAPDATLKPLDTLHQLYAARAVTPDREVVAYCQTGQRSAVAYWVLRLLGYPRVANYAGSWVEWGNDPATPKAQGA
jgi:thiosulfate/3-mercaptopyruvate sulfurtransferase